MTGQNKEDFQYSLLISQLTADIKYERNDIS